MSTPDVPATGWFTSSYSTAQGINCVEVHFSPDAVYVRHSQHPTGAVMRYPHPEWTAFIHNIQTNKFDLNRP